MILSRKEIAEKLRVVVTTIDNYEKKGMPVMRQDGCDPRYDWEEIQKWFKVLQKKEG